MRGRYSLPQIINIYISDINKKFKTALVKDYKRLSYSKSAATKAYSLIQGYSSDDQWYMLWTYLIEIDNIEVGENDDMLELLSVQYDTIDDILGMYNEH